MKFRKLEISNFKCFTAYTWDFTDKLNIVFGPNESGKTTLYQALVLSLFGFKAGRSKNFRDLDRDDFTPLGSDIKPTLKLDFKAADRYFVVNRDFNSSRVQISEGPSPEVQTTDAYQVTEAKRFITSQLGDVEEEIFTKYASINHIDIAGLNASEYQRENRDMGDSLTKLVERQHGAGLLEVQKRINKEFRDNRSDRNSLEKDLEEIQEKLNSDKIIENKLNELQEKLKENRETLKQHKKEFAELDVVLSGYKKRIEQQKEISDLDKNLENLEDEYKRCNKVLDDRREIVNRLENIPSVVRENIYNLKESLEELNNQKSRISTLLKSKQENLDTKKVELENKRKYFDSNYKSILENYDDAQKFKEKENELKSIEIHLSEENSKLRDLTRELHEQEAEKKKYFNISAGAIVISIISIIAGLLLNNVIIGAVIAAILIIAAVVTFLKSGKAVNPDTQIQIQALKNQINELEKQHAGLKSFISQLSSKLGLSSSADFDKVFNDFRNAERELHFLNEMVENLNSELESLLKEEKMSDGNIKELLDKYGMNSIAELSDMVNRCSAIQNELKIIEKRISDEETEERYEDLKLKLQMKRLDLKKLQDDFNEKFAGEPMPEDEFYKKEARHSELSSRINRLENDIRDDEIGIEYREKQISSGVELLEEKLERMAEVKKSYERKDEELEFLDKIIADMIDEYQTSFRPELEQRALELFKTFAGTSDKTFSLQNWPSLEISSTELDGFGERHLSQGTRDQLYFALRIAWCDILTPENIKLPLLWDDPFVYWDEERTAGAIRITQKLLDLEHQILLFTHRQELLDLFKKEISADDIKITYLSV